MGEAGEASDHPSEKKREDGGKVSGGPDMGLLLSQDRTEQ